MLLRFVKTLKKKIANFNRKENDMNLQKIFLNAVVGSSLIAFLCCSGSKQITVAKNTEIEKEVNYIPYYLKTYEAKDLFEQGNYEKSFEILDSLFKKYEPLNQFMVLEYNIYLKSAYLSSNYQIFPEAVAKGIEDYGLSDFLFENDTLLGLVFQYSKIDSNQYNDYWNKYVSKLNLTLRDTIIEMKARDQYNGRKDYDKPEGKRILDSIDSINENLLIYIFEKYGYPDESLVGNMEFSMKRDESPFSTQISHVLLHTRDSIRQAYFLPKIWEFVKKGKASPISYAKMVDQVEMDHKRPPMYGKVRNEVTKDNRKDSLRKSIGLPPIK